MPVPPQEFLTDIAPGLGWFYVSAAAINLAAAWRSWRARNRGTPCLWLALGAGFVVAALGAFLGRPPAMPGPWKSAIDALLGPFTITLGSLALLIGLFLGRRLLVIPAVAWTGFNVSLLFLGTSLTDPVFASLLLRPDNIPIVAMVYLLAFFIWLGAVQAVNNDRRIAGGAAAAEKELVEPVLVWPDLVYIELICMLLLSAALIVWSVGVRAPLEQPANPMLTPNPSKAPWYFVGLQEMLVLLNPTMAGVILPCLIIVGLAALPYVDRNPKGNGYYTIAERRFSYAVFLLGFLQFWILLILVGTFLRGPSWGFFGPYEPRGPHPTSSSNP
jgi:hypothetical protein